MWVNKESVRRFPTHKHHNQNHHADCSKDSIHGNKKLCAFFCSYYFGHFAFTILYRVSEIKFVLKDTYVYLLGQSFATLTSYQTLSLYLMCD